MLSSDPRYGNYLKILQEELVPATGCTEPIAIAYGAAKARELLGVLPESVLVEASGNIIKNVKSVVVPNTNSLKGIEAAAAAGIVAGQSDKILEVISEVTPAQRAEIRTYLADHLIVVKPAEGDKVFDILITLRAGNNHVKLRISDYHTHIVYIEKNGEVLFQSGEVLSDSARDMLTDRSCLSVEGVLDFASTCNLEDVRALIERQIDSMIRNFEARLAQQGLKLADFMKYTGQDEKSFRNQYRDQAEKSVRANLVLEAVENVEKFEAAEEEIDAEIEKFAKQIGQNVEDLKKNLTEGDREYFKADVIRDKAVKFLCDNAKAE